VSKTAIKGAESSSRSPPTRRAMAWNQAKPNPENQYLDPYKVPFLALFLNMGNHRGHICNLEFLEAIMQEPEQQKRQ